MQTLALRIAQAIQKHCIHNALIYLEGGLGAGKTTFTRYLLQALGVKGRIKSPTYSIVETYPLLVGLHTATACHFDFYRFEDEDEWEAAGLRDLFAQDGIKIVEWPSRAKSLLPTPDLAIKIQIAQNLTDEQGNKSLRMVDLTCFSNTGHELMT